MSQYDETHATRSLPETDTEKTERINEEAEERDREMVETAEPDAVEPDE